MTTFFGKKIRKAQALIVKKLPKIGTLDTVEQIDAVLKQLSEDKNGQEKAMILLSDYTNSLLDKRFSLTNPAPVVG